MVDDCTPTTERVKHGWMNYDNWRRGDVIEAADSFDRWLAAHDAEVAEKARADERERIAAAIEALEHSRAERNERVEMGYGVEWPEGYDSAITEAAEIARIARTPDPNGDTPTSDHASQRDGNPIGDHASQRDGDTL